MNEREYRRIVNRQRRLPQQLAAARKRVLDLEQEAERLGMTELLNRPGLLEAAWELEVAIARASNTEVEDWPEQSARYA